jgi:hypothetical protein
VDHLNNFKMHLLICFFMPGSAYLYKKGPIHASSDSPFLNYLAYDVLRFSHWHRTIRPCMYSITYIWTWYEEGSIHIPLSRPRLTLIFLLCSRILRNVVHARSCTVHFLPNMIPAWKNIHLWRSSSMSNFCTLSSYCKITIQKCVIFVFVAQIGWVRGDCYFFFVLDKKCKKVFFFLSPGYVMYMYSLYTKRRQWCSKKPVSYTAK